MLSCTSVAPFEQLVQTPISAGCLVPKRRGVRLSLCLKFRLRARAILCRRRRYCSTLPEWRQPAIACDHFLPISNNYFMTDLKISSKILTGVGDGVACNDHDIACQKSVCRSCPSPGLILLLPVFSHRHGRAPSQSSQVKSFSNPMIWSIIWSVAVAFDAVPAVFGRMT